MPRLYFEKILDKTGPHTDRRGTGESGGTGRRARLRIWWSDPWGFKSLLSHHKFLINHNGLSVKELSNIYTIHNPSYVTLLIRVFITQQQAEGFNYVI